MAEPTIIKKNYKEIPVHQVTAYNSKETSMRWLISKNDGAERYALRRFKLGEEGEIGVHSHPEEHEIYVLSGQGKLFDDKGNILFVKPGDALYVPPNEPHGYKNSGIEPFIFLCIIPYLNKEK